MRHRPLGSTGLSVSAVAFGAGPVPALLTKPGQEARQLDAVRAALDAGVNWFDTAATYGDGESERGLGAALRSLGAAERVHVATKVRLDLARRDDIAGQVRASLDGSLGRLGLERVTLLQLHNAVTHTRGEQPTSVTPEDVLGPGGVLATFEELRREGRVAHFGLTGLGDPAALGAVAASQAFATMQVPYNVLLASRAADGTVDDGPLVRLCAAHGVAVLAIRVLSGGALASRPPSEHTRRTPFFPLDLYERDARRAAELARRLPCGVILPEAALRFVLGRPSVACAIVGFADAEQVAAAARAADAGPLPEAVIAALLAPFPQGEGRA